MKDRKFVLVGTGFVGMSMAYSFLTTGGIDELVLVDVDEEKAIGETMDLQHGLPYARNKLVIKAGGYEECADAEMVVITAGTAQRPGQTRLDMTAVNTKIMKSITENIMASGFDGILLIASNPVDLMTYVAQQVSGLPKNRVIGSGTILDTARLRYLMSEYLGISTCKNLLEMLDENHRDLQDLNEIYHQVQQAAYEIINRKKSTYYGIGLSLNRLVRAILDDEHVILTVSCYQNQEYGQEDLYIGVPAIITRAGVETIIKLKLNEVDQGKFDASCETLKEIIHSTIKPILG